MTSSPTPTRPPPKPRGLLDPALLKPSAAGTTAFLAYASALYLLPLAALVLLVPPGFGIAALAARAGLTILAGYGLFVLATTGHEGFHFTLARRRRLSAALGCLFSACMPLFCATGFFHFHWRHHRHNNSADDPDFAHFTRHPSLMDRLGPARLLLTARYFAATVQAALGRLALDPASPLGAADMRWLARVNLLCQAVLIGAYAMALLWLPGFWIAWLPVLCAGTAISSLNAYQEHAFAPASDRPPGRPGALRQRSAADAGEAFARSRTAPLLTCLHAGSNFHVEHHLYPSVPCWRLPQVHRALMQAGWYEHRASLLDAGVMSTLRYAHPHYRYGGHLFSPAP